MIRFYLILIYRTTAGSVAAEQEALKRHKYAAIGNGYIYAAFGVEHLGPWGPNALKVYRNVAKRLLYVTRDQKAGVNFAQRLSIAIQRDNAASLLGTFPVITYGATITAIQVPDRKGVPDDVVAGFDTLEEYFNPRNPYFGATIGRYANIIREGTMVVRPSGRMYMLSTNKGHHHYNGGYIGFDKVNWRSYVNGNQVIMSHVSDRFHEGFPGTVMAQVSFEVTCDNTIKIEMKCTTSEPTAINLSNAPYFNLAGHHAGCEMAYDHIFTINADKYTVTDDEGIVTGDRKVVGGTPFDFRVPRVLRTMLPRIPMGGYDINFCITQGTEQDLTFQARVLHPNSGRVLEVYSNKPGLQFYTGNLLPDPDKIVENPPTAEEEKEEEESEGSESESEETESSEKGEEAKEEGSEGKVSYGYVPLMGKQGTFYKKHGLFCLMPQNYPDAINHINFPNSVLNPGEVYVHRIQYKFGILLGKYV